MAIDRTGIDSLDLDAGATKSPSGSSIKYEGDIVEPQMKMAEWQGNPGTDSRPEVRQAWKDYLKALQEGTFTGTWQEFMPLWIKGNLASAQGGMEPMSAAQGGIAGYRGDRRRFLHGALGASATPSAAPSREPDSGGSNWQPVSPTPTPTVVDTAAMEDAYTPDVRYTGTDYEAEQVGTQYEDNPPAPVTYTQTGGDASVAEEFYRQNPEMNPSYNVLDYEDPDYNLAYEVNTGLKQEIFDSEGDPTGEFGPGPNVRNCT
jgi:hypothetical protein